MQPSGRIKEDEPSETRVHTVMPVTDDVRSWYADGSRMSPCCPILARSATRGVKASTLEKFLDGDRGFAQRDDRGR